MIEKIIEYSAKNRLIVFILVAAFSIAGWVSMKKAPLDAIPDLSDTQVIIYTDWPGRSPDIIESQVSYPIVTSLLSAPKVTNVRAFSDFGFSYVYVLFEEGTDIYWARSRVLEYMQTLRGKLPEGVTPTLGPDATGLGWVFQYALVDETNSHSLDELRSFQDWYLRYWLSSVDGVAEVAPIGGFVRQYQVNIDPDKLIAYDLSLKEVSEKIRMSNQDVGGRVVEFSGVEYMVRGRGYIKNVEDLRKVGLGVDTNGNPILLRDVATVTLGPEMRRGVTELDGRGEVVGGIIVMRHKENALTVIKRVQDKIKEIEPSLPKGVKIVTVYDRGELIWRAIRTARTALIEELLIVSAMIVFFLLHLRSAAIPIISLPIACLIAFIPMALMKVTVNIMSLGGIIVAIGDMVDASIVMVENAHKRLEEWNKGKRKGTRFDILLESMKEVGPPIFSSLLVMAIAFMPVFVLQAQEGRLFKPLAFTKNFSIAIAAALAITLIPALIVTFIKGKIIFEERHPISRLLIRLYSPVVAWAIRFRGITIALALGIASLSLPMLLRIGSEFMPPLNEGSILYMPTTLPGISVTKASELLETQDQILRSFPEVERVFGKVGRAETATDPAPFSMVETTVLLKPKEEWRAGLTWEKLIEEMDAKMQFPGMTNAWTMPIRNRIDMLTTGIRTPVGVKIFGSDLKVMEKLGEHIEMVLKTVPGTRSVYAERVASGYFLDFDIKREEIARYGLTIMDVNEIINSAIGGENISQTVEGRERYPINLRYQREYRDDLEKLRRVLVPTPTGAHIPLGQLADISFTLGPSMIRDEDGLLSAYVYIDMAGRDIGSYVEEAKKTVREKVTLPAGYSLTWSGQYEYMVRVKERLKLFVPLTLAVIFLLYYFTFKSITETLIIMLSVPFALVGAIWYLYVIDYNMSIAVWVGMIALAGIAAETSSIMIVYLDQAYKQRQLEGKMKTFDDLKEAVMEGAAQRLRPKLMTVLANILGLMPVMWATGTGADVMKRIAAPLVGGLTSSTILTLFILPALYTFWKWEFGLKKASHSKNQ